MSEPLRRGLPWSAAEDRQLYDDFLRKRPIAASARVHQRSYGGIRDRLRRLRLIDRHGVVAEPPPAFAVPAPRRSDGLGFAGEGRQRAVRRLFAVTTPDGWHVEIKSNRRLHDTMIDRLSLMLHGALATSGQER